MDEIRVIKGVGLELIGLKGEDGARLAEGCPSELGVTCGILSLNNKFSRWSQTCQGLPK